MMKLPLHPHIHVPLVILTLTFANANVQNTVTLANQAICGVNALPNYTISDTQREYDETGYDLNQLIFEEMEGTIMGTMNYDPLFASPLDDTSMMMTANYGCPDEFSVVVHSPVPLNNDQYLREKTEYEFKVEVNFTQTDALFNALDDMSILVRLVVAPASTTKEDDTVLHSTNYVQLDRHESPDSSVSYYESVIPYTMMFNETTVAQSMFFTISTNVLLLTANNSSDHVDQFLAIRRIAERSLLYKMQPQRLSITNYFIFFSTFLIAVVSSVLVFFIYMVIRHRKNTVMQLSQWPFLLVLLSFAMCATITARFSTPENNVTCAVGSLVSVISSYIMLTIVIGRLWRSSLLLSSFISIDGDKTNNRRKRLAQINDILSYLIQWKELLVCCTRPLVRRSTLLRNKVSSNDLVRLILILILPILALFIIFFSIEGGFNGKSIYEYDETGLYEKQTCSVDRISNSFMAIYALYLIQQMLCLYMAYLTSDLPSLFNETLSIYKSILTAFVVSLMIIPLLLLSDTPTISPEISSFLYFTNSLVLPMLISWCLMYPKLKVIWSGEKVIVSKLLSQTKNTEQKSSMSATENGVSPSRASTSSSRLHSSYHDTKGFYRSQEHERKSYTIREHDSRPPWIEHHMISLQNLITNINASSFSGMSVSRKNWEELKNLATAFGREMEEIRFDWDNQQVEEVAEEETAVTIPSNNA